MKSRYLITAFLSVVLLAGVSVAQPVGPPSVRCISVLGNGDVQLTWIVPSDPSGFFVNYQVWMSTNDSDGPYSQLAVVPIYGQTSYTHSGANIQAGSNDIYYFIQTQWDDGTGVQTSISSDTVRPIILEITPGAGIANLIWNPIISPNIPTSHGVYMLYKKVGQLGPWNLLDSTNYGSESYTDSVFVCQDSIYYYVEIADSSGCTSVSNVAGEWFVDNTAPAVPVIDSVSVDSVTGYVMVGWNSSASGDTEGYILLHNITGGWVPVDTIWGVNNTYFIDTTVLAIWGCIQFGVAAFDTCWKGNPASPNTSPTGVIHAIMCISATTDGCSRTASIDWTGYTGWQQGVDKYVIYASENNGPWNAVGSVNGGTTSFTHTGLTPNSEYCYSVRAFEQNGNGTSLSYYACVTMIVPTLPSGLYLSKVTVASPTEVELTCLVDTVAQVQWYDIQRATNKLGPWVTIVTLSPPAGNFLTYTDNTTIPSQNSVYYRVVAKDICGNSVAWSNESRTIFLNLNFDDPSLLNNITWNDYVDWDTAGTGVSYYNLFRAVENDFGPTPIASLGFGYHSFTDDLSTETEQIGEFCYYIEAVENIGNPWVGAQVSHSNVNCITVQPRVFVPTAFTPNDNGDNDLFLPIISYSDYRLYTLNIFNRWGQRIFTTNDHLQGWDGTQAGQLVPNGTYIYHLVVQSTEGEEIVKRGHVVVIK